MSDAMKKEAIDGVDFYAAIQAHVRWTIRLEAYMNGTSEEKLDPNVAGGANYCALGTWIHGPGGKHFGNHPQFPELEEAHTRFHACAGEVIRYIDSGETAKARELMRGDYAAQSHKVKSSLAKLGLELKK